MKVTALIPDNLVKEISEYAEGNNLTESLIIALQEWLSLKKIKELNTKIRNKPLEFKENFSARRVRNINRNQ